MDGVGGTGVFWWKTLIRLIVRERDGERETLWLLLFDCLKVLKENVYRIRFKTEILSGGE